MGFYSQDDLAKLGFKSIGKNVKVSERAAIYGHSQISLGDNSRIDDFCVVSGNVTIGRNVHLAVYSHIAGGRPGVTMEDFSGLAYGAQVFAQSDDYSGGTLTNPTVPAKYKKEIEAPVRLGRHCIIGTNAVILPGVTIEEGTSIGAMSMVTRSTKPWSIYFGVPAKRIKDRSRDLLELEKQYLAEE
ncbi:acyltransferase [Litorimonas sp. WD9-15]|uniref:acyltransferase n=1 Tax=Litorimonas sp. WD9-15 TaxID=3418716 RepID=UPI003D05AA46